jgi:hypothetical protein
LFSLTFSQFTHYPFLIHVQKHDYLKKKKNTTLNISTYKIQLCIIYTFLPKLQNISKIKINHGESDPYLLTIRNHKEIDEKSKLSSLLFLSLFLTSSTSISKLITFPKT